MTTRLPGHKTDSPGRKDQQDTDESFDRDLHGDDRAGQHAGVNELRAYTAYDVKALHNTLSDFTNEDLKRIPVLAHGERLEQGGVYLDLSESTREPFVAHGSQAADDPHLYVPKAACDFEVWNRLTGIEHGSERQTNI